jgi:hypothetical protein
VRALHRAGVCCLPISPGGDQAEIPGARPHRAQGAADITRLIDQDIIRWCARRPRGRTRSPRIILGLAP